MSTTTTVTSTINPISRVISLVSILVSIYICRKNVFTPLKVESTKKQLEYVYTPIFSFIEPYLYKKPSILVINELIAIFEKIKSNHYELVNTDLIIHFDILKKSIKNNTYSAKSYENLCIHLDSEFERLRKILSYPRRSFWYKNRYSQFDSENLVFLKEALDFARMLVTIFVYAAFFTLVSALLSKIASILF